MAALFSYPVVFVGDRRQVMLNLLKTALTDSFILIAQIPEELIFYFIECVTSHLPRGSCSEQYAL